MRLSTRGDTVTHMKTTIEISDPLLEEAKAVAAKRGMTLRTLVENGLRAELNALERREPFRLRRAGFRGNGLQPGVRAMSWDRIRELAARDEGA